MDQNSISHCLRPLDADKDESDDQINHRYANKPKLNRDSVSLGVSPSISVSNLSEKEQDREGKY